MASDLYLDELSGLYNRRFLKEKQEEKVKTLIENSTPFSVVWVDIDHFKKINDSYGHLKGDEVIKLFAKFLQDSLRTSDTVIRFGGDEFICVMPDTTRQDAERIYRRILKNCRAKEFGGLMITLSAGIASFPDDADDFWKLLQIADESLYDAKRSGRDRIGATRKKVLEIPTKSFVGRLNEREKLKKIISPEAEETRVVIVKGNIGIGKTRLTREVLTGITKKEVVWSDCLAFAENISYYPIREAIKYRIKRTGKEILTEIPAIYQLEIGKLVPEAIEEIEEHPAGVNLVLDKYRLYESIRKVMEIGKRNKVIIFDNIQWIDRKSIEVIKYLIRVLKSHPITYIFIYRSEEKPKILEDFMLYISREVPVAEINLKPFDDQEIRECIKTMIGEEADKELIDYVTNSSGGNPLFIEEIMREMKETNHLAIEEDSWKFTEPEKEIIPKSIDDIATRKYLGLPKETQEILDIASVVGWFDVNMIKAITNFNQGHIIGLMEDLNKIGFTKFTRDRIEFNEEISRRAIYKSKVADLKKQMLHRKVAGLLEEEYQEKTYEIDEDLAFHYYQARDKEKGVKYCIKAGDSALKKYANQQAKRYYTWALELLADDQEEERIKSKIDCLAKRATVLIISGDNQKAIEDLDAGKEIALAIGDKKSAVNLIIKKATSYVHTSQYEDAILEAKKAEKIAYEIDDKATIAYTLNTYAIVNLRKAQYQKALKFFEKALNIFKEIEDRQGETRVINNIGIIYYDLGDYDNALKYYRNALKIAKESNKKYAEAVSRTNIGVVHNSTGDYFRALEFFEDAVRFGREIGSKRIESLSICSIGDIHSELGDYKQSLQMYQDAIKLSREVGIKYGEAYALRGTGNVNYYLGNIDKAIKFYKISKKIFDQLVISKEKVYTWIYMARLYLDINELKKTKSYINQAYDIAKDAGSNVMLGETLAVLCEYHLKKEALEEFERNITKLAAISEKVKSKIFDSHVKLLQGRYYTKKEDFEKAEVNLRAALKLFEDAQLKMMVGQTYHYLGMMELAKGNKPAAENDFAKALKTFKIINAKRWADKIRQLSS